MIGQKYGGNIVKNIPLNESGKKILDASGLEILSADNLNDAAKKIVKAIK